MHATADASRQSLVGVAQWGEPCRNDSGHSGYEIETGGRWFESNLRRHTLSAHAGQSPSSGYMPEDFHFLAYLLTKEGAATVKTRGLHFICDSIAFVASIASYLFKSPDEKCGWRKALAVFFVGSVYLKHA